MKAQSQRQMQERTTICKTMPSRQMRMQMKEGSEESWKKERVKREE